jgi:hypothetical protein
MFASTLGRSGVAQNWVAGFSFSRYFTGGALLGTVLLGWLTTSSFCLDSRLILATAHNDLNYTQVTSYGRKLKVRNGGGDLAVVRNRLTNNIRAVHLVPREDDLHHFQKRATRYNKLLHSLSVYTRPQEHTVLVDISDVCREYSFADREFQKTMEVRTLSIPLSSSGDTGSEVRGGHWWTALIAGKRNGPSLSDPPRPSIVESIPTGEWVENLEGRTVFPFAGLAVKLNLRCEQDWSGFDSNISEIDRALSLAAVDLIRKRYFNALVRVKSSPSCHPVLLDAQIRTCGLTGKGLTLSDVLDDNPQEFLSEIETLAERVVKEHRGILTHVSVSLQSSSENASLEKALGKAVPSSTPNVSFSEITVT